MPAWWRRASRLSRAASNNRPDRIARAEGARASGTITFVLVISRFRYDDDLAEPATSELQTCLVALGRQTGFVGGSIGRAMDDPTLWVLTTSWRDVGSYRRALSSYEIKATVVPLLSNAVDEPSAYEVIVGEGATEPNQPRPRVT